MIAVLTLACSAGAATIGGVFLGFSVFIMQSLARLPANQGIAAMQSINVVVLESRFVPLFVATSSLSVACLIVSCFFWTQPGSPLLFYCGALFLVGSALVTLACNIPRNEKLEHMDAESPEALEYWPQYVREWTFWNSVRTAASLASAALGVLSVLR